jgi:hypothetical protein
LNGAGEWDTENEAKTRNIIFVGNPLIWGVGGNVDYQNQEGATGKMCVINVD